MIETAVALVFAHMVGDFLMQTDAMVRNKSRAPVLLLHVAIVAALSWAALGFAVAPALIALIAISHIALDAAKLRWGGGGFRPFALDQTGHVAAIALGAALFPESYASGLWAAAAAGPFPDLARLPQAMALGAGLIAAVPAGGYAVASLMTGLKDVPSDPETDASLPKGGQTIGKLERLLILMLVLAGQPDGIGFLIAAKSILRFNELSGDRSRHASEYVIIGTLASFGWAIACGYATLGVLDALRAPP